MVVALPGGVGCTIALCLRSSLVVGYFNIHVYSSTYSKNFCLHFILYVTKDRLSQESKILPFNDVNLLLRMLFPTLYFELLKNFTSGSLSLKY